MVAYNLIEFHLYWFFSHTDGLLISSSSSTQMDVEQRERGRVGEAGHCLKDIN